MVLSPRRSLPPRCPPLVRKEKSVSSPPPPRSSALRANLFTLRFARNWLRVAAIVIGIYAALPILTPALVSAGFAPARILYSAYSPFCHQFAFRSLFLFGEQPAYPRAVTGTSETPFEVVAVNDPDFLESYRYWYRTYNEGIDPGEITEADLGEFTVWMQFAARDFIGNDQMGYKMTLCARDVAIYSALFFGALIYSIPRVRARLRPVPIWLYLLLGIMPIAIDGFSQLLSYPPFNFWEPRETLPIFRIVTGALFGLMNAWLALPQLERSMRETAYQIELKLRRAGVPIPARRGA